MTTPLCPELLGEIRQHTFSHKVSPALRLLTGEIIDRHGLAVRGIIYYGSCLQTGAEFDSLIDLFVLVEDYISAYGKKPGPAFLNWLLPPNVFYLELPFENKMIRAKYSVLSLKDFQEKTTERAFHSYFWARFCQPVAVIYCPDQKVKRRIETGLARAVITFLKRCIPCIGPEFQARDLWLSGLTLSYGAELRSERPERLSMLCHTQGHILERITRAALFDLPYRIQMEEGEKGGLYRTEISITARRMCVIAWRTRSLQGKILSILRLLKATMTFRGGVDYILWKIKRHSGVEIEISPFLRRHPVLAMLVLSGKLFRKGAIR